MAPKKINYQNIIIYQIYCLDPTIDDVYIGSTTNLRLRRSYHKSNCNNEKSKKYNYKVYNFIRANGGFDNFRVELLEQFPCNNKEEALQREGYWIRNKHASLNSCIAGRTMKQYYIDNKDKRKEQMKEYNSKPVTCTCGVKIRRDCLKQHQKTKKHQNLLND